EKADKTIHYITSDEQIITDYHGYLTRSDEVKTKNVNERRYKYIRAKGYDISCTVQYDVAKAPEAFVITMKFMPLLSVNGVLVEPRFTLRVKSKITFEDAIKSKADKVELEATNKVLKSHKHNISDINELQATLDSKADKNHTHKSFTTVRADDIILNFDLGSSAPLENPSTSVKDTLNNLDKSCRNTEDHARNFEAYELPAMLDKKADKNHTHKSFTTVAIESIEGTVEETGGEGGAPPHAAALYCKPPNFPQGLTSDDDITTMRNIRCKDVYVMKDEHNIKFTAQDLYDKKADKNHTHKSFTTVRADDIILNFDLGSSAPLENPSTSVKDTLNNLDKSCRNTEDHARNFEAYELPAMLDKKADKTELQTLKTEILQTLYPIGSIYTSMNSTNPATVLGFGTWEQIVDKFLYCARYSKQTGGSKKITEANLPPHTHTGTTNFSGDHSHSLRDHPLYNSEYEAGNDVLSPSYNNAAKKTFRPTEPGGNHSHTFTTNPTGS
ncbi:keratin-associated protein family, partial [Trichomonas vaginalis G3]|uniref:keratin-associated protein family n=1 Tax=Trichomonas vaginalis (strain ATCC PRA-98 / G3) TaxID=412133 RepID=UPI0021E54703